MKITSSANVVYERDKQVSQVTKLMPMDGKVLIQFSMQVQDKFQISACGQKVVCQVQKQTARKCERYPQVVIHKVCDLTLYHTLLKPLSTF